MTTYNPGPVVTVADLDAGDTVFTSQRRSLEGGLPQPINPVVVTAATPKANGRVEVYVRNARSSQSVAPRLLGDLPGTREFRSAVPVAD